jgi:acetyl-CoA C-acetyltransferase
LSGYESILLGRNHVVIAGGVENMSRYRYSIDKNYLDFKLGHKKITDTLEEVLYDPYTKKRTTELAEEWSEKFNISREELDMFSAKYGLAALCIGGGQGIAAVFERV